MSGKTEKWNFFEKIACAVIALLIIYAVGFAVWTVLYTETGNGDNVEHIHSAWLIACGKVPYRDFFQHHNPLVWYLFAPFMRLFTSQLAVIDAAHIIGLIAGAVMLFIIYKLCTRFFSSRFAAIVSLITICPPYYYIYCFNFNPDTFMALFFALGLYYLFSYLDKNRFFFLAAAFFSFFLAFMFTQKILIVLGQLGIICLYIFYRRKTPLGDIGYALLLPVVGIMLFFVYLYSEGALKLYWLSNYVFNAKMQSYYGNNQISVIDWKVLIFAASVSLLSITLYLKSSSSYFKIIAFLFVTELLMRCFYFSIAPYYMLPLMIFMTCLNSVLLDKVKQKNVLLIYIFLSVAVYYAAISKDRYIMARGTDRSFARYISANLTPCDYVVNGFLGNQSIMSKDPHYYWSMLGHIDIAGEELNIAPKPNVNELILRFKPKFVSSGVYWNNYYLNRGKSVAVQSVSPELLDRYYLPTPFMNLFILKHEFRGRNCRYDPNIKEWIYEKR